MRSKFLVVLLLLLVMPLAHADQAVIKKDDPVLEKRVMTLSEHLRCLVCQNQTIADSNAELAVDLKNQVREKLRQGQTEQEILDYMVKRYGEFVLFKPLVKSTTWLLWFGPLLLLLLGLGVLIVILRQRRKLMQQAPTLSADEHARAASMLSGNGGEGHS
ncbi:Cytochrome c-type biogenesis protein CcmH [Candidatus Nitrotoga sp. BS]|uniref:cytochrome c-type biogenesis protein n=1 Tax=Candidatus Nitrotoga sp. BS TaxID=2890408 RepID=UPI001EF311A1|nr:cytochrome c-type biogenesis protein [Candidatus Nitrotoga sp. BS]CAH1208899.1 Cytochrome c-type biogenesis protein CcmH [Candidatus Nitrotoga sp. BS]